MYYVPNDAGCMDVPMMDAPLYNPLLFVPEVQANATFHHGVCSVTAALAVACGACVSHESAVSSTNQNNITELILVQLSGLFVVNAV